MLLTLGLILYYADTPLFRRQGAIDGDISNDAIFIDTWIM